jgi:hypothetical protein
LKLKRSWLLWQRTGKQKWKGFYTYTALAKEETDPHRRNVLRGLAIAEKHHADLGAGRIRELGGSEPEYTGDLSGQADSLANRIGGMTSHFAVWRLTRGGTSPSTVNSSRYWVTNRASRSCRRSSPMNASITRRLEL